MLHGWVAVDQQQLAHADAGVEIQLVAAAVTGAGDLDTEVGPATPMRVAVAGSAVGENHDHVRDAVIVQPTRLTIAHVGPGVHARGTLQPNRNLKNGRQPALKILMLVIRQWRHHIHALPYLVITIQPGRLALSLHLLFYCWIENHQCHDDLRYALVKLPWQGRLAHAFSIEGAWARRPCH